MVEVTQECFCHKIDPTQGPCQVCARASTAPDAEPVAWMYSSRGFQPDEYRADRREVVPRGWTEQALYTHPAEPVAPAVVEALRKHAASVNQWLRAALDCKAWGWDTDQRQAAEDDHAALSAALAAMGERS